MPTAKQNVKLFFGYSSTRQYWEDAKRTVARQYPTCNLRLFNRALGPQLDALGSLVRAAMTAYERGNPIPAGNLTARQRLVPIVQGIVNTYIAICMTQSGVANHDAMLSVNGGWRDLYEALFSVIDTKITQIRNLSY